MAARKRRKAHKRSTSGTTRRSSRRTAAKAGAKKLVPVGRKTAFDPNSLFPFSGEDDDFYVLCSNGLRGEFAKAANQTCCRVWQSLASKSDHVLGKAMVRMLTASGNDTCLDEEEKQLIRSWKPYQLRYAVGAVIDGCERYELIDPHLTKFKIPPTMDPAIWIWSRPYKEGELWGKGACGIYMVFLHPKFKLTLPGTCGRPHDPN
jgi:hypothetical protein